MTTTDPQPSTPPPAHPRAALLRALTLFAGMLAMLAAYFWVHRPFGLAPGAVPTEALRLGGAALDVATAAVLVILGGAVGAWLCDRLAALAPFSRVALSRLERLALEAGLGLGALALLAVVIGLVGAFRAEVLWGALALMALLLRHRVGRTLAEWRALAGSARVGTPWEVFALACAALLLLLALVSALAPPTHWDSLTYHLIVPTRALSEGAIRADAENFYLGFSQNVEMLYAYAIGLFGRDTAAAPVHFALGLLGVIATAGLARRFAGRWAGWTAVLLLLTATSLWRLFGWAYIDLGTLLYGALALTALAAWHEDRAPGWLIVMGMIAGLAAGVKYNAGALALVMGAGVAVAAPRHVVRNGLIMAAAALIAFAPWLAKGALLYGNPIYPLLFGGLEWDANRTAAFTFPAFSFAGRGWLAHLPFLPFAATVFGQDLVDGYGFTTGPWLLTAFAVLPLVWSTLAPRERRLARTSGLAIGTFWLIWAGVGLASGIGVQTRLMVMALPAFAVAGAVAFIGLWRMPEKPVMITFIVRVAFVITTVLMLADAAMWVVRERSAAYLFSSLPNEQFLYENTGAHGNAMLSLPPDARVRLMWEPRAYLCPETTVCVGDMAFDHWLRPLLAGATPDEVFAGYRASGDDYLLFFDTLYRDYLAFSRDPALDEQFLPALERHMVPVWTDGLRYTLYAWKEGAIAP